MSDDPTSKPHDRLFRRTFGDPEHASSVLALALPDALVTRLDLTTLRAVEASFIETHLQDLCSDLVFEVDLAGEQAFIYVLVEHQRTVDPMMGFRLLRYLVALWGRWLNQNKNAKKLPAVVPLVVHQGRSEWSAPTTFHDLIALPAELLETTATHIPNFTYLVDDLATQSIDDLMRRPMTPFGRLVFVCFQLATRKSDPLDELEPRERAVAQLLATPEGRDAYAAIVSYLLGATEVDPDRLERFSVRLGPEAAEGYMTGAQQLEERGRKKGQALLLVTLAERKFGSLSPAQRGRLEALAPEETIAVAERILDATSFDDLFPG